MNIDNSLIDILAQASVPSSYEIKNLHKIIDSEHGRKLSMMAIYCFNYGKMAGVRHERARRKLRLATKQERKE